MAENPSGPAKPLDVQRLHYLVRLMKRYDLTALDVSDGSVQIRLRRRSPHGDSAALFSTAGDTAAASTQASSHPSQHLGRTAAGDRAGGSQDRRDRKPHGRYLLLLERPRFAALCLGRLASSSQDTIVCIIEAMKVFTDIPAGVSGTIAEILVKNGQAVEFGQPLFRVIPA